MPRIAEVREAKTHPVQRYEYTGWCNAIINSACAVAEEPIKFFGRLLKNSDGTQKEAVVISLLAPSKQKINILGREFEVTLPGLKTYLITSSLRIEGVVLSRITNCEESPFTTEMMDPTKDVVGVSLPTMTNDMHKIVRGFMQSFFTSDHISTHRPIIGKIAEEVIDAMMEEMKAKGSINLFEFFCLFTSKVIFKLVLGYEGELKEYKLFSDLTNVLTNGVYETMHFGYTNKDQKYVNCQAEFDKIAKKIFETAESIKGEPNNTHSLIIHMVKAKNKDGSPKFTEEQLSSLIKMFAIAGKDTTATLLTHCFYHLSKKPLIQTTVHEFLSKDLKSAVGHMPLLETLFNETVRTDPPVPGHIRSTKITWDLFGDGNPLPVGTRILFLNTTAGVNPGVFEDSPEEFNPFRFAYSPNDSVFKGERKQMAFGSGPHKCLGRFYAKEMFEIMVEKLITRAVVKDANNNSGELTYGFMTKFKEELIVTLTPRNQ